MEYKTFKLSEISDKIGDGLHGTPSYNENGDYYFINGNNLNNGKIEIKNDTKKVNENEYEKYKKELNNNTLLLSINGTLGNIARYDGEKIILGKSVCYINIKQQFNVDFIKYIFNSKEFQRYLTVGANGTTIKNVPLSAIRNYEIKIPNIENQNKIANILGKLDNKILINNQTNDNLYEIGKAYYNYLFKQFGYTDKFKKTELGYIPNDYEVNYLSDVTKNNRNKVKEDKGYKVLSAIKTGNLQLSEEYFNKNVPSANLNKYIIVSKDDFAYNPARINIGSIGRNEYEFKTCVSPVYVSFSIDKRYKYFFDFYFKSNLFKSEVVTRASGSVRQTLKYEDFGLIKLVYPSEKIIDKFNYLYKSIDKTIMHNQIENETLTQLRDTLLPKLMSGEIELDKIEI